jgi:hypothetical protein
MLVACAAQAQESPLVLGAGAHYTSGDYGTGTTTTVATLAATARYETGPWVYKATVPYLSVEGDTGVIPGFGQVRAAPVRSDKASGLGDIVLSATYAAYYNPASTLGLDLTAKVKLATADETKGLGTGEHDVAFLADFYRGFGRITGFGGVGYHILGDSPALPLENAWSATLGASYKLDERDSAGARGLRAARAARLLLAQARRRLEGAGLRAHRPRRRQPGLGRRPIARPPVLGTSPATRTAGAPRRA